MPHCDYCCFCSENKIIFIKHQFQAHRYESSFSYKCEISPCDHIFATGSSYASFLTHCNRKHDKWRKALLSLPINEENEPRRNDDPDSTNQSDEAVLLNSSDSMDFNCEDLIDLEHYSTSKEDIERAVAQFLLIFKEKYRLTQAALNFAITSLIDIVNFTSRNIEQSVRAQLVGVDPHVDSLLSKCFTTPDPFVNLRTEYQQNKYYRDNLGLIVRYHVVT